VAHCFRQLQHVDASLNSSRCCTTAHLLYVEKNHPGILLAVYNPCSTFPLYMVICILSTRSCRSVKFVARRWIYIKVIVGGELKEYNNPALDVVSSHSRQDRKLHGKVSRREIPLLQLTLSVTTRRQLNLVEVAKSSRDTHLLACFSVLLWHCGIFTTWKYLKHAHSSTAPAPWLMVLRMLLAKNPLGSQYVAQFHSDSVSF
jgi:hypothetical protein